MYRRATTTVTRAVQQHITSLGSRESLSVVCAEVIIGLGPSLSLDDDIQASSMRYVPPSAPSTCSSTTSSARHMALAATSMAISKRCLSTEAVLDNSPKPEVPQTPLPKPPADSKDGAVSASPKVEKICNEILELNMIELGSLLKVLKSRLGLTDADMRAVPMPGAGAAAAAGGAAPAEEKKVEKENFDIKLVGFDEKSKIKVIKEVRTISGLGLKEAKELVEGAPKILKKDVKKEEAKKLVEKLKEVGAKVELV